uniref:Uncharacterized protein n=1 Tax=Janibacter limosus TaxID=53458 RepID=A0AC61U3N1_9MICO|nr:hypothetical protein [Janibacter limosus]
MSTGPRPVGLVVDDEVALPDAQHDVDRAGEVAAQRLVTEERVVEHVGEGQDRVVSRQVLAHEGREVAQHRLRGRR